MLEGGFSVLMLVAGGLRMNGPGRTLVGKHGFAPPLPKYERQTFWRATSFAGSFGVERFDLAPISIVNVR